MGLISAKITLKNPRQPELPPYECEALADTGTIDLCLPREVADSLCLHALENRAVQTADGKSHVVPYVGPVEVHWNGRGCFVGALVLGNQVLLGAVVMEDMNLIPHPQERKLIENPQLPVV